MSATAETNKPTSPGVPESPTTARPLEMDDDDVQESGVLTEDGSHHPSTTTTTTAPVASPGPPAPGAATEEAPPPKPPRPVSEQQKNEQTLKEAFPSVEPSVIKAVLRASRGQIEPAFNALLEMTDPDAAQNEQEEETPAPPPPPRPQPGTAGLTQMEADELYARQLAEQYENAASSYEQRTSSREAPYHSRVRQQTGLQPDREADENRGRSFLDDDLPEIQENLRKGFIETQSKVNTWFNNLKKKIDDTLDDGPQNRQGQVSGRRPGDSSRRSGDYERYDADPQVLSDDFAGMRFTSDGTPVRNNRPLSNPNLYKPPPPIPGQSGDGRRVAFKDSTESIDAYESSPRLPPKDTAPAATKQSKWQPLSTVDPSPIAENDPFILGDSDDERDAKSKTSGAQGIKMEDSERLKKAAAEAMADSLVDEPKKPEAAAPKKE